MFDQKQIAELKEAFSFIDSNNDGLIDKEDLTDIWTSLGRTHCTDGCRLTGL
jgi:myosin regulatory light chain 12